MLVVFCLFDCIKQTTITNKQTKSRALGIAILGVTEDEKEVNLFMYLELATNKLTN